MAGAVTSVATSTSSISVEPEHVVVDAAVRAVRVALVLADVLGPARGEVAAEDQVGQLQRRIALVGRGSPRRSPSASTSAPSRRGRRRAAGRRAARAASGMRGFGAFARPAAERGLDLVEHAARRHVTDDDEHCTVGTHAVTMQRAHLRARSCRAPRRPAAGRARTDARPTCAARAARDAIVPARERAIVSRSISRSRSVATSSAVDRSAR